MLGFQFHQINFLKIIINALEIVLFYNILELSLVLSKFFCDFKWFSCNMGHEWRGVSSCVIRVFVPHTLIPHSSTPLHSWPRQGYALCGGLRPPKPPSSVSLQAEEPAQPSAWQSQGLRGSLSKVRSSPCFAHFSVLFPCSVTPPSPPRSSEVRSEGFLRLLVPASSPWAFRLLVPRRLQAHVLTAGTSKLRGCSSSTSCWIGFAKLFARECWIWRCLIETFLTN